MRRRWLSCGGSLAKRHSKASYAARFKGVAGYPPFWATGLGWSAVTVKARRSTRSQRRWAAQPTLSVGRCDVTESNYGWIGAADLPNLTTRSGCAPPHRRQGRRQGDSRRTRLATSGGPPGTQRRQSPDTSGMRRFTKLDDAVWLRARYVDDALTVRQIADVIGSNRESVRRALIEVDITLRPTGRRKR